MSSIVYRYGAIFALAALIALCAWWPAARWALVLFVPLLLLALWDLVQTEHTLRRNYPLIARIRWLMEDLRPYLRSYIVEGDLEGRPFNKDQRALVYARAKDDLDSQPFGTELDVYAEGYRWLNHSIVPRTDIPEQWRVDVGGPQCAKPFSASLLNISAMSFGSLGHRAIEALNLGARQGGFYHDTGEGGASRHHFAHGGDLVWEIGTGYFGCRQQDGSFDAHKFAETAQRETVRMTEIKLSQGAKPGHGGVLPGAKVNAEIAKARGVAEGETCVSPPAHSTFSTPTGLLEWAAELRELSGGKPVGIKLCVGMPHEVFAIMKAMRETGILLDYIIVDGAEGGTGAAPTELSDRVGMPCHEGLRVVRDALIGSGLRPHIRIAATSKVHSGFGLAHNFALGADWSNAARAFMFALGCVQSLRCHTDTCPTGIATQNANRQRGLVVEDKAERVCRFQRQTLNALREITVSLGLDHPNKITSEHLWTRLDAARAGSVSTISAMLAEGALIDDPDATPYADAWKRAQATSFAPA